MIASKDFYSPDEVAEMLDLHVRTVRRYIREGRLKAVRIGKQYRIAASDLDALTGSIEAPTASRPVRRTRRVLLSTVVDVTAIGREESDRLTVTLTAVFNSARGEEPGRQLRCVYYEEEGRLSIVVNASLSFTRSLLDLIDTMLEDGRRG